MRILKPVIILTFLICLITTAYSQVKPDYEILADSFNVSNPNAVQAIDIPYGEIDPSKQLFHLFLPDTVGTFPLVIFFHGGGFTDGSPGTVFQDSVRRENVKYFLENEVAFISVGYRLIEKNGPDLDGVIKCLLDAKLGLQYIRHYANDIHIDPNRIALMGSSAGAGTSLWLGFRDDMANPDSENPVLRESTRVSAVFASGTQSTYDIYKWETEIFNNFDGEGTSFTLDSIAEVMTTESLSNFYGGLDSVYQLVHDPAMVEYRQEVDMLYHLSSDDPPLYLFSQNNADHPSDDVLHHWYHSEELYEVALDVNLSEVKVEILYPSIITTDGESGNEFILRHIKTSSETILNVADIPSVEIYPNPASTHFFLNLMNDEIKKVEILSLSGRILSSKSNPDQTKPIPISWLETGVYLVKITGIKTETLRKLVIK